jgi:hypothetical protein
VSVGVKVVVLYFIVYRGRVTIDYSISSWLGYINATIRGKPVAIARFPLVYTALQHHVVDTMARER